jgi:hypothetical protein
MPRQTRPPEGQLAERLDRLFRTLHPKDRGPYTPAEVAEAINEAAGERVVSGTYLWLLRMATDVWLRLPALRRESQASPGTPLPRPATHGAMPHARRHQH